MTMTDEKCEVCRINKPIGVASTMMPVSVAYCVQCARLNAQPEFVFEYWYDSFGADFSAMREGLADAVVTFFDGQYITYRQWATKRAVVK